MVITTTKNVFNHCERRSNCILHHTTAMHFLYCSAQWWIVANLFHSCKITVDPLASSTAQLQCVGKDEKLYCSFIRGCSLEAFVTRVGFRACGWSRHALPWFALQFHGVGLQMNIILVRRSLGHDLIIWFYCPCKFDAWNLGGTFFCLSCIRLYQRTYMWATTALIFLHFLKSLIKIIICQGLKISAPQMLKLFGWFFGWLLFFNVGFINFERFHFQI